MTRARTPRADRPVRFRSAEAGGRAEAGGQALAVASRAALAGGEPHPKGDSSHPLVVDRPPEPPTTHVEAGREGTLAGRAEGLAVREGTVCDLAEKACDAGCPLGDCDFRRWRGICAPCNPHPLHTSAWTPSAVDHLDPGRQRLRPLRVRRWAEEHRRRCLQAATDSGGADNVDVGSRSPVKVLDLPREA